MFLEEDEKYEPTEHLQGHLSFESAKLTYELVVIKHNTNRYILHLNCRGYNWVLSEMLRDLSNVSYYLSESHGRKQQREFFLL